jgi:hypothetical protein
VKEEIDPTVMDDLLAKSKSEILQMFLEETEDLRARYQNIKEGDVTEPTKKEAVLACLQSLRLSAVKKSVRFLDPDGPFMEILFQYVSELGAAIDNIERAYISKEEADIGEPTKREAVLYPLNILLNDIKKASEDAR